MMESVSKLKLLSEINRLRIMNLLFECQLCVCEFQEVLNLSQVCVSKHLTKLRENNFVQTKKVGNRIFYSIDESVLQKKWVFELINNLRREEETLNIDLKVLNKHNKEKDSSKYNCFL